mgnify:CR=1 FL=1
MTPGVQLRVLMNRVEHEGALIEKNPVIGEDGKAEVDLTGMEYVHLNAIKTGWGSPAGTITKVALVAEGASSRSATRADGSVRSISLCLGARVAEPRSPSTK